MIILGVDPGLTRCGVGVIEAGEHRRLSFYSRGRGAVLTGYHPGSASTGHLQRPVREMDSLRTRCRIHRTSVRTIQPQHRTRYRTAAGLAMLAAAQRNIPVALHTPTEAKLAITGNGQAQKIQVERMVTRILNLTKMPTPADAADALALAICHALRPAGALQGGEREQHLTAAQRQWAEAAQKSTRRRINHDRGM